jgi:ABC-2 type transport system permease protein
MRALVIRILALSHKEILHVLRDAQVIYLALGLPVVLVLLFGYAVSFDVDHVEIAVVDQDRTPASRRLVEAIAASDAFSITAHLERPEEAEVLFRRGRVKGAVVIPPDFARKLARSEPAPFQLLLDGSDGTSTKISLGYASGISQAQTIGLLRRAGLPRALPIEPRVRTWYNPDMRSALFVVPGLVAVIVGILAVLLSALTVSREWERGSMEQLFSTPVDRLSVVLGKLIPYVGLCSLQLLLVLVAGAWLFDMPLRGSLLLLAAASVLFLICVLGQGLLISMVAKNQQVATQAGAITAMLPALLLSGFIFPIENMPRVLQLVSYLVPARYMIASLRGILLQGFGLAQLWPQLLGMAILGFVVVGATTLKFQRRLF